jgi:hypothetical protein
VNAATIQGIECHGEGGSQGFAFAGAHFGDLAGVEHRATQELDVEMSLAEGAASRLPRRRERLREQIVQSLALFEAIAQPVRQFA